MINANKEVMQDEMFDTDWYRTLSAQAERADNGDLPVPYWGAVSAFPDGPVSSMVSKVLFGQEVKPAADEAAAEMRKLSSRTNKRVRELSVSRRRLTTVVISSKGG